MIQLCLKSHRRVDLRRFKAALKDHSKGQFKLARVPLFYFLSHRYYPHCTIFNSRKNSNSRSYSEQNYDLNLNSIYGGSSNAKSKLVRFAHNWNDGTMEWWNIGYIRVPSGWKIIRFMGPARHCPWHPIINLGIIIFSRSFGITVASTAVAGG